VRPAPPFHQRGAEAPRAHDDEGVGVDPLHPDFRS
jgi:hypothetical protein